MLATKKLSLAVLFVMWFLAPSQACLLVIGPQGRIEAGDESIYIYGDKCKIISGHAIFDNTNATDSGFSFNDNNVYCDAGDVLVTIENKQMCGRYLNLTEPKHK